MKTITLDKLATQELIETGYCIVKIEGKNYCITKDSDGGMQVFEEVVDWSNLMEDEDENMIYERIED